MQGTITIVGLGFGDVSALPMGTLETLERADALWLRTEDHPVVDWLRERGLGFATFDSVYEAHADFESVYREIVDRLLAEAKAGRPVVYAVPGHPMVAERTVRLLREEGPRHGIRVDVRGGGSFLDAAFARLGIDPIDGFLLLDGTDLSADRLDPRVHQLIAQVYDRMVASDIKLTLMEVYPDDFPVTVANALGVEERERIETVPLYQLDREERFDNLTLLYIPPTDKAAVLNRRFDTLTGIIARLRGPGDVRGIVNRRIRVCANIYWKKRMSFWMRWLKRTLMRWRTNWETYCCRSSFTLRLPGRKAHSISGT